MTSAEYVGLGMPAPDRTWGADDYTRAVNVLTQLEAEDPTLLPRYHSETSGDVFARLIDPDNASFLGKDTLAIEMRVGVALEMQVEVKNLLFLYLRPASNNVVFDDELAELLGYLVASSADLADAMTIFMASLPPDDPNREIRLQGLERMRTGFAEMAAGILTSIAERDTYRLSARRRFAFHARATLPRLAEHYTDLQRQEVIGRLTALAREEPDTVIRDFLTETAAAVETSPQP